ncbi:MAG: hypothetical protein ABEL76_12945 [Bradymonadaceae bacterium]
MEGAHAYRWLTAVAVVAVLGGCDPERPSTGAFDAGGASDAVNAEARGDGDAGTVAFGRGNGTGKMDGVWMLVHQRSNCVLGTEQVSRTVYRVRIRQEGKTLVEERELCSTDIGRVAGVTVDAPRSVVESVSFPRVDRGLVSNVRAGSQYVSSTEVALWGLDLSDPATASLPAEGDDPAVVDADGDGNPGITFLVNGGSCERYAGQRDLIRYVGQFETPTLIRGRSTASTDLKVYGATDSFCSDAPPVVANDAASEFALARIDGRGGAPDADRDGDDEIACEEIRRLPDERLIEPREPEDERCE